MEPLKLAVSSVAGLDAVVSKAPQGCFVVPELADDEDDPDGWQVMGPSKVRVTATVRAFLEHALYDLGHAIPEEYRSHPGVVAQRNSIEALLSGGRPFSVELRDSAPPADGDTSTEAERFRQDSDGRGSELLPAGRPCRPIEEQLGLQEQPEPPRAAAVELGSPQSLCRAVVAPGNGCCDILNSNWYGWLYSSLRKTGIFKEVVCQDFPDPYDAKRSVWLPFLKDELLVCEDTILVGHSSGAQAAMRFAEAWPVGGLVLVSACHTDLGDAGERASGYYPPSGGPWDWAAIRRNAGWIVQFHSKDDCLVPVEEGRFVAEQLRSEYKELDGHSHFFEPFQELLEAIVAKTATA